MKFSYYSPQLLLPPQIWPITFNSKTQKMMTPIRLMLFISIYSCRWSKCYTLQKYPHLLPNYGTSKNILGGGSHSSATGSYIYQTSKVSLQSLKMTLWSALWKRWPYLSSSNPIRKPNRKTLPSLGKSLSTVKRKTPTLIEI